MAVAQDGYALQWASAELRSDREVVMAAVKNYGEALKYASAELRADREVATVAVAQDYRALMLVSDELQGDRELILLAVAKNDRALEYASEELQADPFFVWLKARTRKQRLWTVLSLRFYVVLFITKMQRRVEARDNERFEAEWAEHREELTVGVPECIAKVSFQHGWAAHAGRKRLRVE